ncbi:YybH family protein [Vineibacter terrae]|uniref:YybH family protein n=1 Tax=Vineibacter terrae TaxID=2586908 RepID=UPI002E33FF57|nr:nuclear transport factor 2 family protein [Vineibacter terrae]HEX2892058.1 nuclear transport factor 2 family protein [Vineibacter terrae]
MMLRHDPLPDDIEAMRRWFKSLEDCVNAVDFAAGRPLFAEDMIAFGTFSDFVAERDAVEREQWRHVWPTIRRFHWRLADVKGIVSADRLSGTGMAVWDSDGFHPDGTRFDRRGRATVAFARRQTGDPWVAVHTHMSLFRGTPAVSHGRFSGAADGT